MPLRARSLRSWSLLAASLLAACGGGGDEGPDAAPVVPDAPSVDAAAAPPFRNPLPDLSDEEVALGALQTLGGPVPDAQRSCNACHGLTRARLRDWLAKSDASMAECLTDLQVSEPAAALAMLDCLRAGGQPDGNFAPDRLGFYASAANLEWFDYVFRLAYGETNGPTVRDVFQAQAGMPRAGIPEYTQAQFDVVAEWVARGLPMLDDLVSDGGSGGCTDSIGPAVAAHVTAMQTQGWAAVNATDPTINLFGCAGAATARDCLQDYPSAAAETFGATWDDDLPGAIHRVLFTTTYDSSYWTRSSADGRFVAHGGKDPSNPWYLNSTIIDLSNGATIETIAQYDPGFFPDNSGFAFQGGGGGARFCDQRLLTKDPQPTSINYQEPECNSFSTSVVGLYQHLGKAPNGGDYWTVDGQFQNDNGGQMATIGDFPAGFDASAATDLTPLTFDGTSYVAGSPVRTQTPYEGDAVLSPSAQLVISRVAGPGGAQDGFRLRQVVATPDGSGGYSVSLPEVGRYCVSGMKPAFSFDERWMTYHHYVDDGDAVDLGFTGPDDPGFAAYRTQGAANVYLLNVLTGERTRITRMAPGQYALFPHFRSDGWLYYIVRTRSQAPEQVVATDALFEVLGQ